MFNNIIGNTKFTSDVASVCFEKIYGDYFLGDASFVSTLRATLHNKIGDDELSFVLYTLRDGVDRDIDGSSSNHAVSAIEHLLEYASPRNNSLILYNIGTDGEKADEWFELIQKHFSRAYHGFVRQPKPTIFYKKAFRLLCFTNEAMKCSVVFVNNMSKRAFHYIQCGICGYLPWYFTKENLTEKDVAILTSLRSKNSEDYISALNAIADDFDFRKMKIESELNGFENKFKDAEIRQLQDGILRLRNSIEEYNHRIGDHLHEIEAKNMRLLGLQCSVKETAESEIMEYFLRNKNIELVKTRGTCIEFVAKGYLDFFDEEMAQSIINNNSSYVYRGGFDTSKISTDQMKKLMTSIFVNKNMKIKTCAAYSLSIEGSASGMSGYCFDNVDDCKNRMPNPHIQHYSCLGNYRKSLNESLQCFDFVSAISTCCASVRSLNFGDVTVLSRFMVDMYKSNTSCIELKDGRVVTPQVAVKYIEEECQDEQTN